MFDHESENILNSRVHYLTKAKISVIHLKCAKTMKGSHSFSGPKLRFKIVQFEYVLVEKHKFPLKSCVKIAKLTLDKLCPI
jgi:hypothetical protein